MSYRLLTYLLWPVLFIYTVKIALRDQSSRYFRQRLGFAYSTTGRCIWIHCASVGEVITYASLHRALLKQYPDKQFIITTNTTTGAATVKRLQLERTQHVYLPIENAFAIKRFLNHYQPSHCLVMETEIWPLLYQLCYRRSISLHIINARLSHRTLQANNWIKKQYQQALSLVDKILCKTETEKSNYLQLGATPQQLLVTGNLKFAPPENSQPLEPIDLGRTYCVAASTHHDEESQLATLWQQLDTDCLLVIVPRHPNRSVDIQTQLKQLNIRFAVRSQQQTIEDSTQVYLADTLGELTRFYMNAQFVIIGGSIIERGGQNLLEPARLGKAVICGPHMYNFTDETGLLLEHSACIQVDDIQALSEAATLLLANPDKAIQMGQTAQQLLENKQDVLDAYLTQLELN